MSKLTAIWAGHFDAAICFVNENELSDIFDSLHQDKPNGYWMLFRMDDLKLEQLKMKYQRPRLAVRQ